MAWARLLRAEGSRPAPTLGCWVRPPPEQRGGRTCWTLSLRLPMLDLMARPDARTAAGGRGAMSGVARAAAGSYDG